MPQTRHLGLVYWNIARKLLMRKYFPALLSIAAICSAADFKTGQAARLVIGQKTFTAQTPAATTDDPLTAPGAVLGAVGGVAVANGIVIVADDNRVGAAPDNNRVLIYRNLAAQLPGLTSEIQPYAGRCPVCGGMADVVLGQPDFSTSDLKPASAQTLRLPTAVATDGRVLVVADTDNNRVLIWKSIPTTNQQPADLVLGQPDFKSTVVNEGRGAVPTARSFRGPQGVWVQGGKLFVADTQNHRVLIWNSIPTSNFQPADIVLGQPSFEAATQDNLAATTVAAKPDNMLNPVSVTTDGVSLLVSDLGHNRVLMWNSIPTKNQTPADLALGQPDLTSAVANNSSALCDSNGTDSSGNNTYPAKCEATLNFPRFALSDGKRLFIADGGNDRVLVFNTIPNASGYRADVILGQPASIVNQNSDSAAPLQRSSADSVRTPMGMAWDGTNLYVTDPFNRRVMVFSLAETDLPYTGVRNAASRDVYAVGTVSFSGTINEGDEVTITIGGKDYKYKVLKDDTFTSVVNSFVSLINAGTGDPNVFASPNATLAMVVLTARTSGEPGNNVTLTTALSTSAQIVATTPGATLAGGQDAAKIAPGTIVSIVGDNLSDSSESAPADAQQLPFELANTQVYFDGIRAPLFYVSPSQINTQVPWEVLDATSINAYVRTRRSDGTYSVTNAIAVPIVPQNPGIFAESGPDPRPGVVMHGSSYATGTVSVDGTAQAGDTATIIIEDRQYTYTVQDGDTLNTIRDALVSLIHNGDERVDAFPSSIFTRVRLRARVAGPAGNGIVFSAKANDSAQVIMTATGAALCCANIAYSRVTDDNPAIPGETLIIYATGLGLVTPDEAKQGLNDGIAYNGPELNQPNESVYAMAGGKTANTLFAGAKLRTVGVFEVQLELNSDIPTDPQTQMTIAQDIYVSNIVTFPVRSPKDDVPPPTPTPTP